MKKRAKVHLLPTDKAKNCVLQFGTQFRYCEKYLTQEYLRDLCETSHHLYITTDDEIKEGDWCLFFWDGMKDGELGQVGSEPQQYLPSKGHTLNRNLRKIIATTDSSLKWLTGIEEDFNSETGGLDYKYLPQPPKSFIEEYCRVGGIVDVDVEYESWIEETPTCDYARERPKVDSHNAITIHLTKDSWTVEELPDLLNRFCKDHSLHRGLQITDGMIREWLEKQ